MQLARNSVDDDEPAPEQELRESETQLRLAKDATSLGIHDYNVNANKIYWDNRVREL